MSKEPNPVEKGLIASIDGLAGLIDKVFNKVDEKYGVNLYEKVNELDAKSAEFQKEHPVLNVGKQLLKGTVKGIVGSYTHHK